MDGVIYTIGHSNIELESFLSILQHYRIAHIVDIRQFMCAEKMYFQCHRRLLSDFLAAQGLQVVHIVDADHVIEHKFTDGLRIHSDKSISYPGSEGDLPDQPPLFDL